MKATPTNITKLKKNQVFVFGSNLNGNHAGGAARLAAESFGAIEGQAVGLQGQSYAIPTLDKDMKKLSLETIKNGLLGLKTVVKNSPDKEFLVTKIGCGIAGFDEDEIKPLAYCLIGLENITLPDGWGVIQGFKGYNEGMKCRDMQYSENSEVTEDVDPEICDRGLHYCPMPLDVFNYYPPVNGTTYTEVENFGKVSVGEDKVATNKLRIKTKISISKMFKLHFDLVFDKVKKSISASKETVVTAGNEAHANTAGNYAHANTAGYYAHANTAGYKAHASVSGKNSIAVSLGIRGKAKGNIGNWIVVTEWVQDEDWNWNIKEVKSVLVDGDKIKADMWYSLVKGEFVEDKN